MDHDQSTDNLRGHPESIEMTRGWSFNYLKPNLIELNQPREPP